MKSNLILGLILVLAGLAQTASASFVIDDFSAVGNGVTNVGDGNATVTFLGGVSTSSGDFYRVQPTGFINRINYDFGAQTLGQLYSAMVPDSTPTSVGMDILTIPFTIVTPGTNMQVTLHDDAGNQFDSIFNQVVDPYSHNIYLNGAKAGQLNLAHQIRFTFTGIGTELRFGLPSGTQGASMIANPEPTSLLMFGPVALVGLMRRRRS